MTDMPQYLLSAPLLAAIRAKATHNTPQWQAFLNKLDDELNRVTVDEYQGSELPWIADYALGYLAIKDADPDRASNYADKAIGLIRSALHDDQRNAGSSRMFLARGDGITSQFVLPNADINPATFALWLPNTMVIPVVKGDPDSQDSVASNTQFLQVSLNPDGPADFTQDADWQYSPEYPDDRIDWSLPGREPAMGATYYVTCATTEQVPQTSEGWSVAGNVLTFSTAPTARQAVFVEYQYGTSSGGSSTLGYQQTGDGRGGFNAVYIDSGYPSRYLKYVAIGLDWLWGYAGLTAATRNETMSMLVRWSDYLRDQGYYADSPASNYGAGHYAMRVATAPGAAGPLARRTEIGGRNPGISRGQAGAAVRYAERWSGLAQRRLLVRGVELRRVGHRERSDLGAGRRERRVGQREPRAGMGQPGHRSYAARTANANDHFRRRRWLPMATCLPRQDAHDRPGQHGD